MMSARRLASIPLLILFVAGGQLDAQGRRGRGSSPPAPSPEPAKPRLTAELLSGLPLRGIGPALMSGRIADIAIHPEDQSTWYVAVGSGGVWKTTNAGTTWSPIFDGQGAYSIGCVTIDPKHPEVIWVGTGENVSGRHVGFGDGVYKSLDGGATWQRLGLQKSEHISKILVDPRDSNIVHVAAEGPLWSSGGERGVFTTIDGGATWVLSLDLGADTGVADLEFEPGNPDVLYAAAYQRRRTVWSLLAGGSGSGIYKSNDGGGAWRRLSHGLPGSDLGKIGLAVSPIDPSVVYATIEANEEDRGFYRSADRGESWEKRNNYISGGTGPHYYQEIYASPHAFDRVYQMDVFMRMTDDGGRTFRPVGEPDKHSDNHTLAFDPNDPAYLLSGNDGGLYETFDNAKSWKFIDNLPVTQIYKLALDNASPVYHVVGGTQDNGTQWGPTKTLNQHGIRNRDWIVPYGADGYACAIDPQDPNTVYLSWQSGHPLRYDVASGEALDIQPQPKPGDPPERFNWDAPILISPHDSRRLFYGSYRVWRSDDRGDSWRALSGDLTRKENRYELPVGGRVRSVDVLYGNSAMSWYNTLTALDESPLAEGLLYAGSDDGLIHASEDGGATWNTFKRPAGLPERAFVNEIRASRHNAGVVYAALDNHKEGDYEPYLLRSADRGKSWQSIRGDLPARHLVWSIIEDHVKQELLFAGTEFGVYVTLDGGKHWLPLGAGAPTVAFRDLEIQRRENDLVGASFGRGFFVLDDYSALRGLSEEALAQEAALFPIRDTPWVVPALLLASRDKGSSGSDLYSAPNPPAGALITYYQRDALLTPAAKRRESEKSAPEAAGGVEFPGWETLESERLASEPAVAVVISDAAGNLVRRITAPATVGIHRVAWDLRFPPYELVRLDEPTERAPWDDPPRGPLAPPGRYSAELWRWDGQAAARLGEPQSFAVVFPGDSDGNGDDTVLRTNLRFQQQVGALYATVLRSEQQLERVGEELRKRRKEILERDHADLAALAQLQEGNRALAQLERRLFGDQLRGRFEEPSVPSVLERLSQIIGGHWSTRTGPTQTHRASFAAASDEWAAVRSEIERLVAAYP